METARTYDWNMKLSNIRKMLKKYGHQVTLTDLMISDDISREKALRWIEQANLHYLGSNHK